MEKKLEDLIFSHFNNLNKLIVNTDKEFDKLEFDKLDIPISLDNTDEETNKSINLELDKSIYLNNAKQLWGMLLVT